MEFTCSACGRLMNEEDPFVPGDYEEALKGDGHDFDPETLCGDCAIDYPGVVGDANPEAGTHHRDGEMNMWTVVFAGRINIYRRFARALRRARQQGAGWIGGPVYQGGYCLVRGCGCAAHHI